jgi:DNA-binding XRE family transcriptional regulator
MSRVVGAHTLIFQSSIGSQSVPFRRPRKDAEQEPRPSSRFEIAQRFRALRKQSHLTQSHLAEIIGICRQSVSRIENFHVMPHCRTWDKFCALEERHKRAREDSLLIGWI